MQIAIALYPRFTSLDAIGPYEVFSEVPGAEVVLCAARTGPLADDHDSFKVLVEHSFDDVTSPDIVVVPGGPVASGQAVFVTGHLGRSGAGRPDGD